jgi:uncharacterized protein YdgA (DUF945 family)
MQSYKSPFQSIGVAGAIAAILIGVAQVLGYTIEPSHAKDLGELIAGSVTIVAGIAAAVGRIRASARIRLRG